MKAFLRLPSHVPLPGTLTWWDNCGITGSGVKPGALNYFGGSAMWHPHQWSLRDSLAWFPDAHLSIPMFAEQDPRLPLSLSHMDSPDSLLSWGCCVPSRPRGRAGWKGLPPSSFRVLLGLSRLLLPSFPGRRCPAGVPSPGLPFLRHPASPPSCKPWVQ